MDEWFQVAEDRWRREAELPVGRSVAEIHQRGPGGAYEIRVAVCFAGPAARPDPVEKRANGLVTLPQAKHSCDALLRDLISTRHWVWTGKQLM